MDMLNKKLTYSEINSIIKPCVDLEFIDINNNIECPHYVLFDSGGEEFYGVNDNLKYDFTTLRDIIFYIVDTVSEEVKRKTMDDIFKIINDGLLKIKNDKFGC